MYKEGRQFVVDAKKEIDGVVKDVKGIQADAKGIWGFFSNLFGAKKQEVKVAEAPKKKVKELDIKEDKIEQTLLAEVDTYDQYIRGDIYGFIISEVTTDEEGNEIKEEVDSCWSFYGYDSCVQETEYIVNELTKNDLYVEQTANP